MDRSETGHETETVDIETDKNLIQMTSRQGWLVDQGRRRPTVVGRNLVGVDQPLQGLLRAAAQDRDLGLGARIEPHLHDAPSKLKGCRGIDDDNAAQALWVVRRVDVGDALEVLERVRRRQPQRPPRRVDHTKKRLNGMSCGHSLRAEALHHLLRHPDVVPHHAVDSCQLLELGNLTSAKALVDDWAALLVEARTPCWEMVVEDLEVARDNIRGSHAAQPDYVGLLAPLDVRLEHVPGLSHVELARTQKSQQEVVLGLSWLAAVRFDRKPVRVCAPTQLLEGRLLILSQVAEEALFSGCKSVHGVVGVHFRLRRGRCLRGQCNSFDEHARVTILASGSNDNHRRDDSGLTSLLTCLPWRQGAARSTLSDLLACLLRRGRCGHGTPESVWRPRLGLAITCHSVGRSQGRE
eukprot:m.245324 g.245324  ORF g.245324 m.245324 type:complete len:409 (+) comp14680_c0_seq1:56-1282(+)